jgi:hypothetical protein
MINSDSKKYLVIASPMRVGEKSAILILPINISRLIRALPVAFFQLEL